MSKVSLISYTTANPGSVNLEMMTSQDIITYCARVSNPSNQSKMDTSEKLLKYLIDHKHWSPLEMVDVTLEIETTRDIGRQILRHRSFSFQEFSQRYADPTVSGLGFETREARWQDTKNRQNSIELDDDNPELQKEWLQHQHTMIGLAQGVYEWALDKGIAKEVARAVLPEGLTKTRMYMKGSLRSWVHFYFVRSDPSTQKETRIIAEQCWQHLTGVYPFLKSLVTKP